MATEMSSSQHKLVHEQRPVMSANLFLAAIKGDEDVLIQCLGLLEEQKEVKVAIEDSNSAPEQIKIENQTVQSELQSATRFGDTVLHILVTERHNELALKVFERDRSLLKARNKMLETPLYCAVKLGNEKVIHHLIQIDLVAVKDALEETNDNGDTVLHIAAKHGHINVACELMKLYPDIAYMDNNEMLSPMYIAIVKRYTMMVQTMLEVDPNLACTKFSDGMYPVHVAARMGNMGLTIHFIEKYRNYAELLDSRGRNFFHIAAEENPSNRSDLFWNIFKVTSVGEIIVKMNNAMDYEGNTPWHIAAMGGRRKVMRAIWKNKKNHVAETIQNNEGLTPFELSARQLVESNEDIDDLDISNYIETRGYKFTREWFDVIMESTLPNKWEKSQVIGLGSVLITTVTFAAAFTIPGGYNQDDGTPILGRRYMFRAFILANALAFIQGFVSLFALLTKIRRGPPGRVLKFAIYAFLLAASSMVVAFGLGLYVTLAPVCFPIAILLLVITVIVGSPAVFVVIVTGEHCFRSGSNIHRTVATGLTSFVVSFLLIFCLALM